MPLGHTFLCWKKSLTQNPFIKLYVAYVASLNKMLKKFPFGDSILKDLGIVNPDQVCSYAFSTAEGLAKRFPQLGLADSESINILRDELMDLKLSPQNTLLLILTNQLQVITNLELDDF